ncbi:2-oxoglutarate dehydrogenase complex dihydrolipoyllysine-residue succinyltransferase [Salicibibacter cibarius]|uniref:Dihydrolipoyllysine-residue succinyltransferase component of 2-oxoglutarate dehydrogenase complex n=1 Tax=Salicibibacter cibarius TaxID=2743000 RepID=A0A7T7CBK7_9BACI|nr:2-oxoglutarate dehydrogenase complex dihydrolipoyllysine-residue succinyltransferase [Salicibibacter cibarius]QQK76094.1 2-oxoglutarate dehydrogenase complex dihydrolipoyllysine-residue succinyltransferase [Salicibibacter cibarius]
MAEIKVPELAESITEGTIAEWLKKPGDFVEKGEAVAELETDKVNVELNAEQSGVLQEIISEEGADVSVGDVVATLDENATEGSSGTSGESETKEEDSKGEKEETQADKREGDNKEAKTETASQQESSETAEDASSEHVVASPAARKLAREKGINLDDIPVRDPLGRVRKEDVESYESNKAAQKQTSTQKSASENDEESDEFGGKPVERERMSRRRQTIANRLVDVQQSTAMLTTFNEVDMSAIMDLRKRKKESFQEKHDGTKLGMMSFFTKGVIGALKQYPLLNAEIQGKDIIKKNFYDIGMAVSTDNGLVVPVVRDADRLSFAGIEEEVGRLSKKARDNKLGLDDLQGGTFTITNGGVFGSLLSTPILNTPQVGILGMHTIQWRPVAIDKERMENRPMMYTALSYDHRIVDGKEAVSFLVTLKQLLEEPENLLLEG